MVTLTENATGDQVSKLGQSSLHFTLFLMPLEKI